MGKLGNHSRVSPRHKGANSLRQNQRVRHTLRTPHAVVKHQGRWWWVDSEDPRKWQSTVGGASEIQPAEPEMTNSSYTDKAGAGQYMRFDFKERNASG
jgi:hypothetical protein